jgi:hypothetical protein
MSQQNLAYAYPFGDLRLDECARRIASKEVMVVEELGPARGC